MKPTVSEYCHRADYGETQIEYPRNLDYKLYAVLRFTGGVISGPIVTDLRSQPIIEPLLFHPNRVGAGRS